MPIPTQRQIGRDEHMSHESRTSDMLAASVTGHTLRELTYSSTSSDSTVSGAVNQTMFSS